MGRHVKQVVELFSSQYKSDIDMSTRGPGAAILHPLCDQSSFDGSGKSNIPHFTGCLRDLALTG